MQVNDCFTACMMIEGELPATDTELDDAWQYLIDTDIVWQLQGWYGRTAMERLTRGDSTVTNRHLN